MCGAFVPTGSTFEEGPEAILAHTKTAHNLLLSAAIPPQPQCCELQRVLYKATRPSRYALGQAGAVS